MSCSIFHWNISFIRIVVIKYKISSAYILKIQFDLGWQNRTPQLLWLFELPYVNTDIGTNGIETATEMFAHCIGVPCVHIIVKKLTYICRVRLSSTHKYISDTGSWIHQYKTRTCQSCNVNALTTYYMTTPGEALGVVIQTEHAHDFVALWSVVFILSYKVDSCDFLVHIRQHCITVQTECPSASKVILKVMSKIRSVPDYDKTIKNPCTYFPRYNICFCSIFWLPRGMGPANKKQCYNVTPSFTARSLSQNDLCSAKEGLKFSCFLSIFYIFGLYI